MECPDGLKSEDDTVLLLRKSLYGLVQAARQFYKKWAEILKKIGFKQSDVDPCLFVLEGRMYIGTYVDNNYVIGESEDIEWFINKITKMKINVTKSEGLNDYLSCKTILQEMG